MESQECKVHSLGQTLAGREIDCLTIGTGPRTCWIIHRQHPGESMASFYAEGLLTRLLGLDDDWDGVAKKAKELYTFKIVPNVNPDGSVNGHLRTNGAGQNLNREWAPSSAPAEDSSNANGEECKVPYDAPTLERSPEVYHILRHMDETGCDAFLDIHGDEDLPFNFLAGSQGMPNWDKRLEAMHGAFLAAYERTNSDMQAKVSYDPDKPNEGLKNICSNQIALRFDCFSGTLEMPFKELWQKEGWGPDRARQLGASVLDPLCYIWKYLRDDKPFWEGLPPEDAYAIPSSKYDK
jgi:murein tripeptide amidase MpaA